MEAKNNSVEATMMSAKDVKALFQEQAQIVVKELESKYEIPEGKLESSVKFVIEMLSKHPLMRPHRIAKKTAFQFHLKRKVHAAG